MCGRAYASYTDEELAIRYGWEQLKRDPLGNRKPNYNIAPTHIMPVVLKSDDGLETKLMRWGLIPAWSKSVKEASKYSLINARSEEITEKRSYAKPFKTQRCIFPVSGFYEWKREGETKRPFAIHLKDSPVMSIAAIWEHWVGKEDGELVDSFSLLTTSANSFMEKIHNRQPVLLDPAGEQLWLNANASEDQLRTLFDPCPSAWLEAHEVSTAVNSPKNNDPRVLEPLR